MLVEHAPVRDAEEYPRHPLSRAWNEPLNPSSRRTASTVAVFLVSPSRLRDRRRKVNATRTGSKYYPPIETQQYGAASQSRSHRLPFGSPR